MNDDPIPFQKSARHLHPVETAMRHFDGDDLRLECREGRKSHGFEFNLLTAEKASAQISERNREAKSGEGPAWLDVDVLRNILCLVLFANMRACGLGHKVCDEFALRLSPLEFSPRPLLLD